MGWVDGRVRVLKEGAEDREGREGERRRTFTTAPLDALYQTNPGRGRDAPTLAMLMIDPPVPWEMRCGMTAWVPWKTDLTLTRKTRSKSDSVTEEVG